MRRRYGAVLAAAVLWAGCAGGVDDPATVYEHRWFYGPGYAPDGGFPVFEDTFPVDEGSGQLTVKIEWRVSEGQAAVELTLPDGEPANWTSADSGGPVGEFEATVAAQAGTWNVRIPTWSDDEAFPEGQIDVDVLA